ncbi:hypothetical protein PRIPAC_70577 [Pristionchus pacificus]|uniref:Uncharacterized protein n=1 Tax=Pristionchus pacificus TaxID=54126 RepID=A0A454XS58_PRIPA|nr:hypothetical protein PRIPAC_70577 [Pristionchus pacificus]|eukprot:PDM76997.1 hypothetical protein PRIPAC_42392 [Pristionchus pacificus]
MATETEILKGYLLIWRVRHLSRKYSVAPKTSRSAAFNRILNSAMDNAPELLRTALGLTGGRRNHNLQTNLRAEILGRAIESLSDTPQISDVKDCCETLDCSPAEESALYLCILSFRA